MCSPQTSGSLVSVIGSHPEDIAEWELCKVRSGRPAAQFHTKYWGKAMLADKHEWRDPINVDEDGGDEDDIIEGCYFLNIDAKGTNCPSTIWIRADYIRVYDFLKYRYDHPVYPPQKPPCAVITGQPGIGKSVWIYYALRRRLSEKEPVIWWYQHACYLFVNEGVYRVPDDFAPGFFKTIVWTLIDSDESKEGIPSRLVAPGSRLFAIFSTSPRKERWSRLHKTTNDELLIMNPWSRKEILRAVLTIQPGTIDCDRANAAFDQLGPTPRLCIEAMSIPLKLDHYVKETQAAISMLTVEVFEKLSRDSRALTMDEVSHKIFLVSRIDRSMVNSLPILSPITPSIQSRLASHFRQLQQAEQIRLFHYFSKVPDSRQVAGILFEAAAQRRLQDGVVLRLVQMVRLPEANNGRPQWYSSHIPLRNKSLEVYRQNASKKGLDIQISPSRTDEYASHNPFRILPGVLYVPESTNQVAFDSFIVLGSHIYIFQFTIAMQHDIKSGLIDFLGKCSAIPSTKNWRFVFIHPPGQTLTCPQPWRIEMRKLHPFTAAISLPRPWNRSRTRYKKPVP